MPDEEREALTVQWLHEALCCAEPGRERLLRERAVMLNQGFATSLARRFRGLSVEFEDLEQVALIGLCRAVSGYREPCAGFTPYAVPTILGELRRYFRDHAWLVRPPRSLQETDQVVRRETPRLTQLLAREPSNADLAEHLGLTCEDVGRSRIADRAFHGVALDAPLGASDLTLTDVLGVEDRTDLCDWRVDLSRALASMTPRQRAVLKLRFERDLTQREIGEVIGVSQMQVSRILMQCLGQLRVALTATDAA